ncbi:MAG: SpaH/EbpB family LPXTG-anchored major pilin [Faecalibacterium prausnitzii]|nr:SpaH/EbpB family LPXTG-anchored major pilin [Faecalibacterium prausnitzii]
MKKIFHSLLVLLCTAALLCGAVLPAFAEGAPANGSININKAANGETYDIYRIFDLESYTTGENGKYSYTLSEKWANVGFGTADAFTTYFKLENGYVYPKNESSYNDSATAAEFAVKALAFAKEKKIDNDGSQEATNGSVAFTGLTLGYYLVDTSLGTLCSLTTTNPTVRIDEKNSVPDIEKNIVENNQLVSSNNATIGSTINYRVTIHAKKGATGYVLTDTLSAGLTFNNDVKVKIGETSYTSPADYTVATGTSNDFTVTFNQSMLDKLTGNTDILVTYSATLNKDAVIHDGVNKNTVKLHYGNNSETTEKTTSTSTYKFDLVKTDASNTLLAGAKFKLYDSQEGGKEIKLTEVNDHTYRPAVGDEKGDDIVTIGNAPITIQGLANGTYWLEEIQQPAGYNKLTKRKSVKLENGNNIATMEGTTYNPANNGGLHIVNQSGTVLPGTGGMGTTLFYIVGGGLMVAAFVLLIAKKRMENKD